MPSTKKSPKTAKKAETTGLPNPVELIVRRGALRRFDQLKAKTANLPVTVTWDRRLTERRTSTDAAPGDQRKADRRQTPASTWDLADFVVVERVDEPDSGSAE